MREYWFLVVGGQVVTTSGESASLQVNGIVGDDSRRCNVRTIGRQAQYNRRASAVSEATVPWRYSNTCTVPYLIITHLSLGSTDPWVQGSEGLSARPALGSWVLA